MGQMTKLDPNVTKQLMNQPGSNPGTAISDDRLWRGALLQHAVLCLYVVTQQ